MKRKNHSWTKEECYKIAASCTYRRQFSIKNPSAYQKSRKEGWLDEICSHMVSNRNGLYKKDVYAIISDEINTVYIGISHDPNERYLGHKKRPSDNVKILLSHNHKLVVLEKNIKNEYLKGIENFYIDLYRSQEWNIANEIRGGHLGKSLVKWTKEDIKSKSILFSNRMDFYKSFPGIYDIMYAKGWLQEITAHMKNKTKEKIYDVGDFQGTLTQISKEFDISRNTLKDRLKRGCTEKELINNQKQILIEINNEMLTKKQIATKYGFPLTCITSRYAAGCEGKDLIKDYHYSQVRNRK